MRRTGFRAEIYGYVLRNWRIVKVATTKAQRKLFFSLRQAKKSLNWLSRQETENLAGNLGVAVSDVETMEQRLYIPDVPFESSDNSQEAEEDSPSAPSSYLHDPESNPALLLEHHHDAEQSSRNLSAALAQLNERQLDIIQSRWLSENKATLSDLSKRYGVSIERIRQIEKAAIEKLGRLMSNTLIA